MIAWDSIVIETYLRSSVISDYVYELILRDPAVCIFVTGAARRGEERLEVKLRRQRL